MPDCLNCHKSLNGNIYCGHCGQKNIRKTLDIIAIFGDIWSTLTDVDNRWYKTFREMLSRPGSMVAEHIDGKRIRYASPVQYFLVCSAIAVALGNPIDSGFLSDGWEPDSLLEYLVIDLLALVESYPAGYVMMLTPLAAVSVMIAFPKSKRNYTEILTLTVYLLSQAAILLTSLILLGSSLNAYVSQTSESLASFASLMPLIGPLPFYFGWAFSDFFGTSLIPGYFSGLLVLTGFIVLLIALLASLTAILN